MPLKIESCHPNGVSEGDRNLCQQLQFLLDNPQTVSDYRSKAQQRSRAVYRWEDVVSDHLALYQQVLNGDRPSHNPNVCPQAGRTCSYIDLH